ncbi:uncharacterized protein EI90DRAFT_3161566 [Cantharellus anzutake]|uniref:uncharacterized protein n=1 Tax=Cantharellus anzutake TaxID=1750568 RepID=UPI00190711AD|nr:uncharacterized protein EI90DRAFT_3161566 [Cantharellus anzutake]KAF8309868.1 hypothetical protein EI90DRAFT_3161566 [Cantharellus anzutake]
MGSHIPEPSIRKKVAKQLCTSFGGTMSFWLELIPQVMPCWTKVCIGNGGDLIRGAIAHSASVNEQNLRDASFVWYELNIDIKAHLPKAEPKFVQRVFYGRLEYILECAIPPNRVSKNGEPRIRLLAVITTLDTCHIHAYPIPTRLPDLLLSHLRSHTLPLPVPILTFGPGNTPPSTSHATSTPPSLSSPISVRSDTHLGPNTTPLTTLLLLLLLLLRSSFTTPPPFRHPPTLLPSAPILTLRPDNSPLHHSSLLPLVLFRRPPAKLRPSTAVPYFVLGHRSYLCSEPPS